MGLSINKTTFSAEDYKIFDQKIAEQLNILEELVLQPGFGVGEPTIGAELEISLTDKNALAAHDNNTLLIEHKDPRLQLELNRFNLEFNLTPTPLAGNPFSIIENEMQSAIHGLAQTASHHDLKIVSTGILPTLTKQDLTEECISDLARYKALNKSLKDLKKNPFQIEINGPEPIKFSHDNVTLEGACTSLQIHLKVAPHDFVDMFNAAQLATPFAVAISANSPTFLGNHLWQETRVALFKQSVDPRSPNVKSSGHPPRVTFGEDWMQTPTQCFKETVNNYQSLIPAWTEEEAANQLKLSQVPQMKELRLHHGTVWHWNRSVFDPHDGGHLRIEFRALPSGPTPIDMLANTAFLLGLTLSLFKQSKTLCHSLLFSQAENNFYRAAQDGLDATVQWPNEEHNAIQNVKIKDCIQSFISLAKNGLLSVGVKADEIEYYMNIIEKRLNNGQTGSKWQIEKLKSLSQHLNKKEALAAMTLDYINKSSTNTPVHEWDM